MREPDELYHEEIGFVWGRIAVALMLLVGLSQFVLLALQIANGPIGDQPAPDIVYVLLGAWFFLIGVALLNFATLTISVTPRGITTAYGRIRYHVAWDNLAGYEIDPRRATLAYGGYGIRIARRNGQSIILYNLTGAPLLILEQKRGRFKYVGFSTRQPEQLEALIRSWQK